MPKLIIENTGDIKDLNPGDSIGPTCEEAGVPFACSEGYCGTCIVEVIQGAENLTQPTQQELDFLGEEGVKKERMACQCRMKEGCAKEASVTIRT